MNFSQWLDSVNGKYVEMAGSANAQNQCVDCANSCIKNFFGLPMIEWTNAIDFPSRAGDKYDYILNSLTGLPKEGDLMIFGLGSYGHISVFIEGNLSTFKSMDQNYPLNTPCHIVTHNYNNVLGWLHFKGSIINDMTDEQVRILAFLANKTEGDVREAFGALEDLSNKIKEIDDLKEKAIILQTKLTEVTTNLTTKAKELKLCHSELETANQTVSNLSDYKRWYEAKLVEIKKLTTKIEELEKLDEMTPFQHIKFGIKNLFIKKTNDRKF